MRLRYNIKELKIACIPSVHRMYDSLSEESKRLFHPGFLGLTSISARWFLAQMALLASSFRCLRKVLTRTFPLAVILYSVAINQRNEVIGFAFIKVKKRLFKEGFLGELGICVREDRQGREIGSKLMENLIGLARKENVKRIYLTVLTDNVKAIHLYRKYGFKKKGIIEGGDLWCGRRYNCIEMWLDITLRFNPS